LDCCLAFRATGWRGEERRGEERRGERASVKYAERDGKRERERITGEKNGEEEKQSVSVSR